MAQRAYGPGVVGSQATPCGPLASPSIRPGPYAGWTAHPQGCMAHGASCRERHMPAAHLGRAAYAHVPAALPAAFSPHLSQGSRQHCDTRRSTNTGLLRSSQAASRRCVTAQCSSVAAADSSGAAGPAAGSAIVSAEADAGTPWEVLLDWVLYRAEGATGSGHGGPGQVAAGRTSDGSVQGAMGPGLSGQGPVGSNPVDAQGQGYADAAASDDGSVDDRASSHAQASTSASTSNYGATSTCASTSSASGRASDGAQSGRAVARFSGMRAGDKVLRVSSWVALLQGLRAARPGQASKLVASSQERHMLPNQQTQTPLHLVAKDGDVPQGPGGDLHLSPEGDMPPSQGGGIAASGQRAWLRDRATWEAVVGVVVDVLHADTSQRRLKNAKPEVLAQLLLASCELLQARAERWTWGRARTARAEGGGGAGADQAGAGARSQPQSQPGAGAGAGSESQSQPGAGAGQAKAGAGSTAGAGAAFQVGVGLPQGVLVAGGALREQRLQQAQAHGRWCQVTLVVLRPHLPHLAPHQLLAVLRGLGAGTGRADKQPFKPDPLWIQTLFETMLAPLPQSTAPSAPSVEAATSGAMSESGPAPTSELRARQGSGKGARAEGGVISLEALDGPMLAAVCKALSYVVRSPEVPQAWLQALDARVPQLAKGSHKGSWGGSLQPWVYAIFVAVVQMGQIPGPELLALVQRQPASTASVARHDASSGSVTDSHGNGGDSAAGFAPTLWVEVLWAFASLHLLPPRWLLLEALQRTVPALAAMSDEKQGQAAWAVAMLLSPRSQLQLQPQPQSQAQPQLRSQSQPQLQVTPGLKQKAFTSAPLMAQQGKAGMDGHTHRQSQGMASAAEHTHSQGLGQGEAWEEGWREVWAGGTLEPLAQRWWEALQAATLPRLPFLTASQLDALSWALASSGCQVQQGWLHVHASSVPAVLRESTGHTAVRLALAYARLGATWKPQPAAGASVGSAGAPSAAAAGVGPAPAHSAAVAAASAVTTAATAAAAAAAVATLPEVEDPLDFLLSGGKQAVQVPDALASAMLHHTARHMDSLPAVDLVALAVAFGTMSLSLHDNRQARSAGAHERRASRGRLAGGSSGSEQEDAALQAATTALAAAAGVQPSLDRGLVKRWVSTYLAAAAPHVPHMRILDLSRVLWGLGQLGVEVPHKWGQEAAGQLRWQLQLAAGKVYTEHQVEEASGETAAVQDDLRQLYWGQHLSGCRLPVLAVTEITAAVSGLALQPSIPLRSDLMAAVEAAVTAAGEALATTSNRDHTGSRSLPDHAALELRQDESAGRGPEGQVGTERVQGEGRGDSMLRWQLLDEVLSAAAAVQVAWAWQQQQKQQKQQKQQRQQQLQRLQRSPGQSGTPAGVNAPAAAEAGSQMLAAAEAASAQLLQPLLTTLQAADPTTQIHSEGGMAEQPGSLDPPQGQQAPVAILPIIGLRLLPGPLGTLAAATAQFPQQPSTASAYSGAAVITATERLQPTRLLGRRALLRLLASLAQMSCRPGCAWWAALRQALSPLAAQHPASPPRSPGNVNPRDDLHGLQGSAAWELLQALHPLLPAINTSSRAAAAPQRELHAEVAAVLCMLLMAVISEAEHDAPSRVPTKGARMASSGSLLDGDNSTQVSEAGVPAYQVLVDCLGWAVGPQAATKQGRSSPHADTRTVKPTGSGPDAGAGAVKPTGVGTGAAVSVSDAIDVQSAVPLEGLLGPGEVLMVLKLAASAQAAAAAGDQRIHGHLTSAQPASTSGSASDSTGVSAGMSSSSSTTSYGSTSTSYSSSSSTSYGSSTPPAPTNADASTTSGSSTSPRPGNAVSLRHDLWGWVAESLTATSDPDADFPSRVVQLLQLLASMGAKIPKAHAKHLAAALDTWLSAPPSSAGKHAPPQRKPLPKHLLLEGVLSPEACAQLLISCSCLELQPSPAWLGACLRHCLDTDEQCKGLGTDAEQQNSIRTDEQQSSEQQSSIRTKGQAGRQHEAGQQRPLQLQEGAVLQGLATNDCILLAEAAVKLSLGISSAEGTSCAGVSASGPAAASPSSLPATSAGTATRDARGLLQALVVRLIKSRLPQAETAAACRLAVSLAAAPRLSRWGLPLVLEDFNRRLRVSAVKAGATAGGDWTAMNAVLQRLMLICSTLHKVKVSPGARVWASAQEVVVAAAGNVCLAPHSPSKGGASRPPPPSSTAPSMPSAAPSHRPLGPSFSPAAYLLQACKLLAQASVPLTREAMDALCSVTAPTLLAATAGAWEKQQQQQHQGVAAGHSANQGSLQGPASNASSTSQQATPEPAGTPARVPLFGSKPKVELVRPERPSGNLLAASLSSAAHSTDAAGPTRSTSGMGRSGSSSGSSSSSGPSGSAANAGRRLRQGTGNGAHVFSFAPGPGSWAAAAAAAAAQKAGGASSSLSGLGGAMLLPLLEPSQVVTLAWVVASSRGPSARRDFVQLLTPALLTAIQHTAATQVTQPPFSAPTKLTAGQSSSPRQPRPQPASAPSSDGSRHSAPTLSSSERVMGAAPDSSSAAVGTRSIGTALWALGRLDATLSPRLAIGLLRFTEARFKDMGPHELSDVAFGFARIADAPMRSARSGQLDPSSTWTPGERWLDALCERLAQPIVLTKLRPKHLSHLIWSLAKMGHTPDQPLMARLLGQARACLGGFSTDGLSLLLYGLAGMSYQPPTKWMQAYLARSLQLLRSPSPSSTGGYGARSLARTAWALAALSARQDSGQPLVPSVWLHRFVQRVRSQLPECDAQSLTQLALGLSVLGPTLSPGFMAAFVRALQRQPTSLDLQVQANMMWAWRRLRGRMEVERKGRKGTPAGHRAKAHRGKAVLQRNFRLRTGRAAVRRRD